MWKNTSIKESKIVRMVWKYASNKFKKNHSTFYRGAWIDNRRLTRAFRVYRLIEIITSYRRVDLFVELPTVICPGSRSILDLSLLHGSFHLSLSLAPLLPRNHARSFPLVSLLFSSGAKPDWFPRWYIFSTLASISRHFITIKRARHALSPCCIMAIHQRVVLPASIAIQIGANPRWLSLLMTLKSWRGCSIFRTFDRGVIKCVAHDLSNITCMLLFYQS